MKADIRVESIYNDKRCGQGKARQDSKCQSLQRAVMLFTTSFLYPCVSTYSLSVLSKRVL